MDKLSDIAKDYLADFDVLTEARKECEKELNNWWRDLISKHVEPALTKANHGKPDYTWDNKSKVIPGLYECSVRKNQDIRLRLTDPRNSGRGYYTVMLLAVNLTELKKMSKQEELVTRLNDLAIKLKIVDQSGLKWTSSSIVLAKEDITISADDPEETVHQVCDVTLRFFQLVMEHGAANGDAGA